MLFTWDTNNLCIIFRQWHITSTVSLVFSLLGVVALTAGYELVRELSRRYEASSAEYMNKLPRKHPGIFRHHAVQDLG
jgi:solute carrier family 31 (copper transporter), member 1